MEVWQDYPAKAVNWAVFVEGMSLEDGKKFFGGKCVLGGIDNRPSSVFVSGSKESSRRLICDWIDTHKEAGMMIGADCTLPRGIELGRIKEAIHTAKTYHISN